MQTRTSSFLKYLLLLVITTSLLWLSLRSFQVTEGETKLGFMYKVWTRADKWFLFLSALATLLSHYIRAVRWKLLLNPLGHKLTVTHSVLSVMNGYFVNLAIPRGGELSRCYNLKKLNGTPMDQSFGTVVAERIVDLLFLLSLISLAFLSELDTLLYFFGQLNLGFSQESSDFSLLWLGIPFFAVAAISFFILMKQRKSIRMRKRIVKLRNVLMGMKKGLTIVFQLDQKALFIFYSLAIWVLYYLMSYFIIKAFPETAHLGLQESLIIFVIGGIAMAVPLPGGAGSYHVLVPLGMVLLYSIGQKEAIAFSFIFHGFQTLMLIFLGILSLFISQWYIRRKKSEYSIQNSQS